MPESRPRTFQNVTRSETSELLNSNSFLFLAGAWGHAGSFSLDQAKDCPWQSERRPKGWSSREFPHYFPSNEQSPHMVTALHGTSPLAWCLPL